MSILTNKTSVPFILLAFQLIAGAIQLLSGRWHMSAAVLLMSFLLGVVSFFGLLLWCAQCVRSHPALTRLTLHSLLVLSVCWGGLYILAPFMESKTQSNAQRESMIRTFRQLIAEGKIPHSPKIPDDFQVSSRHGAGPVLISYLDTDHVKRAYIATSHISRSWSFKSLSKEQSEIFYVESR